MNRTEYMRQLESLLQNISATEREEALQYYNEYFNDAGPEGEQKLIEELGSPKEAAADLISNLLDKKLQEDKEVSKTASRSTMRIALLALLATPVAAPLMVALLTMLFAAAICIVAAIVCVFVFGFAILIIGSKLFIRGVVAVPYSIPGGIMILGTGIFGIGCAILLGILGVYICKWIGLLFIRLVQHFTRKRGNAK